VASESSRVVVQILVLTNAMKLPVVRNPLSYVCVVDVALMLVGADEADDDWLDDALPVVMPLLENPGSVVLFGSTEYVTLEVRK
jgi:hypothetical protein